MNVSLVDKSAELFQAFAELGADDQIHCALHVQDGLKGVVWPKEIQQTSLDSLHDLSILYKRKGRFLKDERERNLKAGVSGDQELAVLELAMRLLNHYFAALCFLREHPRPGTAAIVAEVESNFQRQFKDVERYLDEN